MARKLCKFNVRSYEFTSGCRRPRPRPRYLKVPIDELTRLGVNEYLIHWIATILTSRPQRVKINGILSTTVLPNGGIP